MSSWYAVGLGIFYVGLIYTIAFILYMAYKAIEDWRIHHLNNQVINIYNQSISMTLDDINKTWQWLDELPRDCNSKYINQAKEFMEHRIKVLDNE